jgi:hypothetical protein
MRRPRLFLLLVCALSLLTFAPKAATAPTLSEKPVKYEFAELTFLRAAGPWGKGGGGLAGGGGPAAWGAASPIKWTTAEEEIEVEQWSDLADKLKAPAAKKESPPSVHKLRVLNKLSVDGW